MMLNIFSQRQGSLTDYILWSDYRGFLISASGETWKTLLKYHRFFFLGVFKTGLKTAYLDKPTHFCSIVANKMQAIAVAFHTQSRSLFF
jgi:hypothetical protein